MHRQPENNANTLTVLDAQWTINKSRKIECHRVPCNLASAWLKPNCVDSINAATSFAPQSNTFPPRTPLTTARHCSSCDILSMSASRADNSFSACSFSCCFCYSRHIYYYLIRSSIYAAHYKLYLKSTNIPAISCKCVTLSSKTSSLANSATALSHSDGPYLNLWCMRLSLYTDNVPLSKSSQDHPNNSTDTMCISNVSRSTAHVT